MVPSGAWLPAESYLTISGSIMGNLDAQALWRRQILLGLPTTREVALVVHDIDQDRQGFVRRYDKPSFQLSPTFMQFQVPLMMADPYKYGVVPVGGFMGVFTGQTWYRTYNSVGGGGGSGYSDTYSDTYGGGSGTTWKRTYAQAGGTGPWRRYYVQAEAAGPYPDTLSVESLGTVESRRVTIQVTGPLTAGSWWLYNLATGGKQWAQLSLGPTQMLTLNSQDRTATVDGLDASHLVFGDWLTLAPGTNTYRLAAATRTDAYASVSALDAFE